MGDLLHEVGGASHIMAAIKAEMALFSSSCVRGRCLQSTVARDVHKTIQNETETFCSETETRCRHVSRPRRSRDV
jgi:hypothetical protein